MCTTGLAVPCHWQHERSTGEHQTCGLSKHDLWLMPCCPMSVEGMNMSRLAGFTWCTATSRSRRKSNENDEPNELISLSHDNMWPLPCGLQFCFTSIALTPSLRDYPSSNVASGCTDGGTDQLLQPHRPIHLVLVGKPR